MSRPSAAEIRTHAPVVVGGLALGALWWLLDGLGELPVTLSTLDLVLFVLAAGGMELLPIRLPGGRAVPTSVAVVGAAAVLGAAPLVLALLASSGWLFARVLDRGPSRPEALLMRVVGAWSLAGVAAVGAHLGPATWTGSGDSGPAASLQVGAALAISLAIVVGIPMLGAVTDGRTRWRFAGRRILEAVQHNLAIGTSVASTAVLGALVHPVLGLWTLPTMLVPLLAARVGLDRWAVARRAYDQTIRAMSRLPEQLGTVSSDHGVRVGVLAGEVALELGLDAATVRDVVRAAHLHELGRIKLEREAPAAQAELALAGASVIREVAELERVAGIVGLHGNPPVDGGGDPEVALPARIVAACCELDRYAPDPSDAGQRHEVAVRLVRVVGDLEVVAALTRVVDRVGDGGAAGV